MSPLCGPVASDDFEIWKKKILKWALIEHPKVLGSTTSFEV